MVNQKPGTIAAAQLDNIEYFFEGKDKSLDASMIANEEAKH